MIGHYTTGLARGPGRTGPNRTLPPTSVSGFPFGPTDPGRGTGPTATTGDGREPNPYPSPVPSGDA